MHQTGGLAFSVAALLSLVLLSVALVVWARSYLYADSWVVSSFVPPTNPPVSFVSPVTGEMVRQEFAKTPNLYNQLPTWHSESGRFYIPQFRLWFVQGSARSVGFWRPFRPDMAPHLKAIGSLAVPYWAIAAASAVCPAAWLWRFRRTRFPGQRVRFGVGQLMAGVAAVCIAMYFYRVLGMAGVLFTGNVALAAGLGYLFAQWSARPEVAGLRMPLRLVSVMLSFLECGIAMYFACQIVYQVAIDRAWRL